MCQVSDRADSIPNRLRQRRDATYEHDAEIARMMKRRWPEIGKSRQTVGYYMKGDQNPSPAWVVAYCHLTNTNPYWLLTGDGPEEWGDVEQADYDAGRRDLANELRDWLKENAPEKEEEGGDELATRELLENGGDGDEGE